MTSWFFSSSLIALRSIFDAIRILMRFSLSDSAGMWHSRFPEGSIPYFCKYYQTIIVNSVSEFYPLNVIQFTT